MGKVNSIGDGLGREAAVRLEEGLVWGNRFLGTQGPLVFCTMTSGLIAPERRRLVGPAKHHLEARWPG